MKEMMDYGGKYDPDRKFEDFSKEVLLKLLEEYRSLWGILDGMYQTEIAKRHGVNEAMEIAESLWKNYGSREQKRIGKTLNIQGNDVETFHKLLQFAPSNPGAAYEFDIELKNKNHSVMKITRCKNLEWIEQNDPQRIIPLCQQAEVAIISACAQFVNQKIKTTPLKLPPRMVPGEKPCCVWEFKLEE